MSSDTNTLRQSTPVCCNNCKHLVFDGETYVCRCNDVANVVDRNDLACGNFAHIPVDLTTLGAGVDPQTARQHPNWLEPPELPPGLPDYAELVARVVELKQHICAVDERINAIGGQLIEIEGRLAAHFQAFGMTDTIISKINERLDKQRSVIQSHARAMAMLISGNVEGM